MTKLLAFVGLLAILSVIAAAIFFFGGYYNVAGTATDPEIVKWALSHVRDASIEHHAQDNPPLPLDDPAIVRAGARAFSERGCVNCHGAPGVDWAKFSEGMRPDPPRPQGTGQRDLAARAVLGDQERHQHDRNAELRCH